MNYQPQLVQDFVHQLYVTSSCITFIVQVLKLVKQIAPVPWILRLKSFLDLIIDRSLEMDQSDELYCKVWKYKHTCYMLHV